MSASIIPPRLVLFTPRVNNHPHPGPHHTGPRLTNNQFDGGQRRGPDLKKKLVVVGDGGECNQAAVGWGKAEPCAAGGRPSSRLGWGKARKARKTAPRHKPSLVLLSPRRHAAASCPCAHKVHAETTRAALHASRSAQPCLPCALAGSSPHVATRTCTDADTPKAAARPAS